MEELLKEFTQFFCPTNLDRVMDRKDGLTSEQYTKLTTLLYKNQDLFAAGMTDLVGTDVLYHTIDTGDADSVRKRPYRQSPEMMKEMKRPVEEMAKAGIIERK